MSPEHRVVKDSYEATITNLLHQDPADLQQCTEENHLSLYANNPSENTDKKKKQHTVKTKHTALTGTHRVQVNLATLLLRAKCGGNTMLVCKSTACKVGNLGGGHVSVDPIPSFICWVFDKRKNMLLCCTVSQAASIPLWFIQITEMQKEQCYPLMLGIQITEHHLLRTSSLAFWWNVVLYI